MYRNTIALVLFAPLASAAVFAPLARAPNYCSKDDLYRCFTHSPSAASSYCDAMDVTTTTTTTTTRTIEATATTTVTVAKGALPRLVRFAAVEARMPAPGDGPMPKPLACMSTSTFSPQQVTSACSCISDPITTTTTTETDTTTTTETTTTVPVTVTTPCPALVIPVFVPGTTSNFVFSENSHKLIELKNPTTDAAYIFLSTQVKVPKMHSYRVTVPFDDKMTVSGCTATLTDDAGSTPVVLVFNSGARQDMNFFVTNPGNTVMTRTYTLEVMCPSGPDDLFIGNFRSVCLS